MKNLNTTKQTSDAAQAQKRLIIAGGGTGGHLYPGIAVAEYLKDKEVEVFFMVSDRGIERKILTDKGYNFYEQKQVPFKGISMVGKARSFFALIEETIKMLGLIKKNDTVLLTGGFAAGAPAIAAVLKRADLYLHEQNSVMGLTNRIFSSFCKKVFLSFDGTLKSKGNTVHTGNPVRAEFTKIKQKETSGKRILVLGGSQGSRFLNRLIAKSAKALNEDGWSIVQQTGIKLYDEAKADFAKEGGEADLRSYIDNVANEYEQADVVIARAGSGTVFETMYALRPAIFIPFAEATDEHQLYNALFAEKLGIAKTLTEGSATPQALKKLLDWSQGEEVKQKLNEVTHLNSAQIIVRGMQLD
jgi:UDP-N-acetylglucosamine--N-acetylmuramyl-(pentapeptide) pyrophosphoryl-undecaprenol N-acetylglucosamine transferase